MTWKYRIIRTPTEHGYTFEIHRIDYGPSGDVEKWSATPVCTRGDSMDALRGDIEHQLESLGQAVLEVTEDGSKLRTVEEEYL